MACIETPKRSRSSEPARDSQTAKRQRRAIRNRESAMRSRQRKRAELDGLKALVARLTNENLALRMRMSRCQCQARTCSLQDFDILYGQKTERTCIIKTEKCPKPTPKSFFKPKSGRLVNTSTIRGDAVANHFGTLQLEVSHRVSENHTDIGLDLNGIEAVLEKSSSPSFDDDFGLGSNSALLFNDNALCSATPSATPSASPSAITPSLDPCRVGRFEPLFKPLYSASSKQISACTADLSFDACKADLSFDACKADLSFDACCSELSESSGSSGESTGAEELGISQSASSSPIHELIWD